MRRSDSDEARDEESSPGRLGEVDLSPLVSACVAGDRHAMHRLYQHCVERVYGLMVRMVGRQDADDLTQQVFLQAFRKLDQFHGGSSLQTWLYRLAANEALQHLRREKLRRTQPLEIDPLAHSQDFAIDASERVEVVQSALARLDPELRLMLSLKEEQQLSYRQIAETLSIPEGTVGSRLNRARQALRTELIRLGWESA